MSPTHGAMNSGMDEGKLSGRQTADKHLKGI